METSCANLASCLSHQRHLHTTTKIDRMPAQECHKMAATANLATQSALLCFPPILFDTCYLLYLNWKLCAFRGRALSASDFWQQLKELVGGTAACRDQSAGFKLGQLSSHLILSQVAQPRPPPDFPGCPSVVVVCPVVPRNFPA